MSELSFDDRVDLIESGYEFMLAYAAQGRDDDQGGAGPTIRDVLEDLLRAMAGLGKSLANDGDAQQDFLAVLEQDAAKASAAVTLALSRPQISSQLIDNLNASIHLRAVLTDLFLLDEAGR